MTFVGGKWWTLLDSSSLYLDEACSLIIDVGAKYIRVGYSGDERPTVVMPSHVGILRDERPVFGDLALTCPRPGMEIKPIISDTEGKSILAIVDDPFA